MLHTFQNLHDPPLAAGESLPLLRRRRQPGNASRRRNCDSRSSRLQPQPIQKNRSIQYRFRLLGMPFSWLARISKWNLPHEFVDEQLSGPYKQWVHTHRFQERDGNTVIDDEVTYRLPLSLLGEIAFPLTRWQLRRIFAFRQEAIREFLPLPG